MNKNGIQSYYTDDELKEINEYLERRLKETPDIRLTKTHLQKIGFLNHIRNVQL